MLKRLRLRHFKGFRKFDVAFTQPAILVGPNNAGKSTIITALRVAALMLRQGKRLNPSRRIRQGGDDFLGHPFASDQFDLIDENLRHEFRPLETRLELEFTNGSCLVAVWPTPGKDDPHFFFVDSQRSPLETAQAVARLFPDLGTVPPLSPLEQKEEALQPHYVRRHLSTRLAPRHFRNQLLLLAEGGEWASFSAFLAEWVPDIKLEKPTVGRLGDDTTVNVFFSEGRGPKELVWAGDGIQVFLQLLVHLYRLRGTPTVVLDEPEVFLHADLQRRLLRVATSCTNQPVIATHSAEIVAEAEPESVVMIEKGRSASLIASDPEVMDQLRSGLGTTFNLNLARALKADLAVFVEGDDTVLLRNVARTIGAKHLANESGVVVSKLRGVDNWERVVGFQWVARDLLRDAVNGYVILDRDYRSDGARGSVEKTLRRSGVGAHVWRRKEIESYLIVPEAIARLVDLPIELVISFVEDGLDELRSETEDQVIKTRLRERQHERVDGSTVIREAKLELDATWTTLENKLTFVSAKKLIRRLNRRLQGSCGKTVSARVLSKALTVDEVPSEIEIIIMNLEEMLLDARSAIPSVLSGR